MLADRIEGKWIDAFCEVLTGCAVKAGDIVAILSETQSRTLNVQLAELALLRLGARPFHVVVPTPANRHPVAVRSTGASEAIGSLAPVVAALGACALVVDCTLEGLMHAPETPDILRAGARILVISNEHPEALERMRPDAVLEGRVRAAARMLREGRRMHVASAAGTKLDIDMEGARTVGIWGWTQRPGTLAHWPGGVVVSFPKSGTVNGTLVLDRGEEAVWKSFRNLGERVQIVLPEELNAYDVLVNDSIVFSKASLETVVARLSDSGESHE